MRVARVLNAFAALSVAFVAACAGASAAERAGPHWLAADYIAAHEAESPEWRLHYSATDFGSGLGGAFAIGLAETYAYVETDTRITIYDFTVERILEFDRAAGRFGSASFYMVPAAALGELQNRLKVMAPLARMMQESGAGGVSPTAIDRFWIESDLGVMGPAEGAPSISVTDEVDGTTRYVHAGEVVATIVATEHEIPAEAAHGVDVVMRRMTRLHPAILGDVAARNVIPAALSYVVYGSDGTARTASIRLKEIEERTAASYPLPAGAVPDDGGLTPALAPLVSQVRAIVAGDEDWRFRRDSDYQAAAIAAAGERRWLAVQLILLERMLQYGPEAPCEDPAICFDVAANEAAMLADPDVIAYQAALEQDRSGGDPKIAIATMRGFDRSGLLNPAILDLLIANTMSVNRIEPAEGEPGAEQLLLGYIASNPYVGAAYNDLGQHLWRESRLAEAWQMFDLARALGPVPGLAPLTRLDQAEQSIKRAAPAFFQ